MARSEQVTNDLLESVVDMAADRWMTDELAELYLKVRESGKCTDDSDDWKRLNHISAVRSRSCWRAEMPKRSVLLVCHMLDSTQVADTLRIAIASGADGMFLIDHSPTVSSFDYIEALMLCHAQLQKLRSLDKRFRLGLNPLGCGMGGEQDLYSAFGVLGMLWLDSIDGLSPEMQHQRSVLRMMRVYCQLANGKAADRHCLFGGFDFKYQDKVPKSEFDAVANMVSTYADVLTTSGDATGSPPSVEKMERIRRAVGPTPLVAIASGITTENVVNYLPTTDIFLVATGVADKGSFYRTDPEKLKQLCETVHSYKGT